MAMTIADEPQWNKNDNETNKLDHVAMNIADQPKENQKPQQNEIVGPRVDNHR